jgi:four helix bundle protein
VRDHTKLRGFELADALALLTYRCTASFPRHELFALVSQMRRAAVSIPCNIVEGCARHTEGEYIRYLDIAYGSARELEYQVSLAYRLGFLGDADYQSMSTACVETSKVLNGLIRALRN